MQVALVASCGAAVCCLATRSWAFTANPMNPPRDRSPVTSRGFPQDMKGVTLHTDGTMFYNPDSETVGRLRGLGRLLDVVGGKIADSASEITSNSWLQESFSTSKNGLHACGTNLQDASAALIQERWADADALIGAAREQCGTFLPNEHLAAVQRLLVDSRTVNDAKEALKALGSILEVRAEVPVLSKVEDLLWEAAGALRAAARLFTTTAPKAAPRRHAAAAPSRLGAIALGATQAGVTPALARELEEALSTAAPGKYQSTLRALAKKYHPDRHPGREMEVLPMFLHVQQLRENSRWGERV